jgi:hypothetical protein
MKSGFLPKDRSPDELIAGTAKDPSLLDGDIPEGDVEAGEGAEPAAAPAG